MDSLQGERNCSTCLTRLLCWVDLGLIFFRCVFEKVNVEHFAEDVEAHKPCRQHMGPVTERSAHELA